MATAFRLGVMAVTGAVTALMGCSTSPSPDASRAVASDSGTFSDVGTSPDSGSTTVEPECVAPAGFTAPRDVESLRLWINALPKPTSLSCFVASLPRPLMAQASLSEFSAQVTTTRKNPRIFLFRDALIMTLLGEGAGSTLLEFSVLESATRSLKAEIEFPVLEEVSARAPYEKALFDADITGCAFCHAAETPATAITFTTAFVSEALRPNPSLRVPLAELNASRDLCTGETASGRCALLDAMFAQGQVVEHDFPELMPICFPSP